MDDYTHDCDPANPNIVDCDPVHPNIVEPDPDSSPPVIASEGDHYNHPKDPLASF